MLLGVNFLIGTACFANSVDTTHSNMMHEGLFFGLGTDYNSINLTQYSWGKGVGNITTSTGANSNGVAEGTGAPFKNTTHTFAPEIQAGYFRHFPCYQNYLYGVKFTYQFLGSTAVNPNLYIPQVGTTTSATTGAVSPLYGWVNVDQVQVTTNHQLALLAFVGQSFGNKYVYLGAGPAAFNIQSRNYYSIGYAQFNGDTINATGLISYSTPSLWLPGGAAQVGMTYFFDPSWFIDVSYTYAVSASRTVNHTQGYTNSSSVGTTAYISAGNLYTRNTVRVNNQSVRLTINKVLDV